MNAQDYVGIATCITATAAAAVSIIVAIHQRPIAAQVDEVHAAVSVSNGGTLGGAVEDIARATNANDGTPPA